MVPAPKHHRDCVDEEACPLMSLQELLEWKEPKSGGGVRRLFQPRASPSSQPLTLVCHDMKGGYLDDRFVSGCSNKDAYRFYHWSGVDTFVYFSHHLVTIPPPAWINAAHLHGVSVLGTFITEWEAGSAVCKDLLASEGTVETAVNQLTRIAHYHGFEGWLVNIENEVPPAKIPLLLYFLRKLTSAMRTTDANRKMEEKIMKEEETRKESKEIEKKLTEDETNMERKEVNELYGKSHNIHRVIWYDSVTENGKLEWQNELNPHNQAFFNACDGIFLNYTWTEAHLDRTKKAAAATGSGFEGDRISDVFVGLDIFGRNFYAGGKYNTWKALDVVRKYGLSAAIFAPGWTFETQDNFVEAEKCMWRSLAPYLNHQGPQHLPLTTSFCQGYGDHFYCRGKVEKEGAWHDLSLQQLQPLWSQEGEKEDACLSLVTQDAYNGGGCLGITTLSPTTVRFLLCDLEWQATLRLSVAYKWCGTSTTLILLCYLSRSQDASSSSQSRVLEFRCEESKGEQKKKEKDYGDDNPITQCPLLDSHEENGWSVRIFTAHEMPGYKMKEICLRLEGAADLRLGHLDVSSVTQHKAQMKVTDADSLLHKES